MTLIGTIGGFQSIVMSAIALIISRISSIKFMLDLLQSIFQVDKHKDLPILERLKLEKLRNGTKTGLYSMKNVKKKKRTKHTSLDKLDLESIMTTFKLTSAFRLAI